MNCEKIQELILTDYIDDQMDKSHKKYLEDHLSRCSQCLEFLAAVQKSAVQPFDNREQLIPSANIWLRIQESILLEQRGKGNFLTHWWETFKSTAIFSRPALAFGMVVIVFFMIGTLHQFKFNKTINAKEQMEYLDSLANPPADFSVNNGNGYGTLVEQYFL